MGEDDVDVLELQALEARLDALNDVLARQAPAVDRSVVGGPIAKVQFRCDDDLVPGRAQLLEGLAPRELGLAAGVHLQRREARRSTLPPSSSSFLSFPTHFRVIEEVDSAFERDLERLVDGVA